MAELLTLENFESAAFDDWQQILDRIYRDKNDSRQPSDMWLRTVSDASKVGEAVRKGDAHEAMEYMVHTLSWIITTTNKLMNHPYNGSASLLTYDSKPHTSLTDIVLAKYPRVCPVCQEERCHCPILRQVIEEANPEKRKQIKAKMKEDRRKKLLLKQADMEENVLPKSIADIASMLDGIYGQVHYGESIQNITFHFLEEVGEVAWCLTSLDEGILTNQKDKTPLNIQLADEIADVIAWSFAIVGKLANSAEQANRLMDVFRPMSPDTIDIVTVSSEQKYNLLARWLWSSFYDQKDSKLCCPSCGEEPCNCQRF